MRDYVLLIFVVGLVPFILWRAWLGALAWTWIGLMNPHLYAWTLTTFPFAQVIGITFIVAWLIAQDKRMIPFTPEMVALCLFVAFVTLKTPFAWNQDVAWDIWKQFMKVVVAALMMTTLIYNPQRIRWFFWTVLFSLGVFYGVKGGIFALASGGQLQVQGPEPSFIGGNTHLGVALLMVAPMFVAFMRDAKSKWLQRASIAGLWLTLIAIFFTYSRGAWLGLAAISALLFLQSKRKVLVALALIPIGMAGIAFTPEKLFDRMGTISEYEEDTSALQRLQGWGVATNVALRHPLGAGFTLDATPVDVWMSYANFHHPAFNRANAAHSIYFQALGDHGFFGLGLFLCICIATFITLWRARRKVAGDPERAWLGHYATAIQIGLVGYLVAGAFVSLAYYDLFYTFVISASILLREANFAAPNTERAVDGRALRAVGSMLEQKSRDPKVRARGGLGTQPERPVPTNRLT